VDGDFAEILDRAATALAAPAHPHMVQPAISRLLAQGETSGTDTALGLLTSVDALLSSARREAPNRRGKATSFPELAAGRRGWV
jgi:hypothetical protein